MFSVVIIIFGENFVILGVVCSSVNFKVIGNMRMMIVVV